MLILRFVRKDRGLGLFINLILIILTQIVQRNRLELELLNDYDSY